MAKKKIMLPKHMEPQARLFAEIACELNGLTPSHKDYKKEYKQAYHDFCLEAYKHSLTPSGELGSNPKKGHASAIAKEHMMAVDKMTDTWAKGLGGKDKEEITQRLRGAITNLTHLFMEVQFKHIIKGKGVKGRAGKEMLKTRYSNYEIPDGSKGDYATMAQVMIRLYERNFFATILTMAIYGVFTADFPKTDKLLTEYIPAIKEDHWQGSDASNKQLYKELRKKENRDQFIRAVVYNFPLGELMPKGQKVFKLAKGKPKVMPEKKERITKKKLNEILDGLLSGAKLVTKKDSDGAFYKIEHKNYDFSFDGILLTDFSGASTLYETFFQAAKKKLEISDTPTVDEENRIFTAFLKEDAFRDMRLKTFEDHTYSQLTQIMKTIVSSKIAKGGQTELFGGNPRLRKKKTQVKRKVKKKSPRR